MNVSDTELINAILLKDGYSMAPTINDADVVFLNTCAIRENAENKVWSRLRELKG